MLHNVECDLRRRRKRLRRLTWAVGLVLAILAGASTSHAATPFEAIRSLINEGHYAEARTVGDKIAGDEKQRRLHGAFIEALILKHKGKLDDAAALMRDLLDENPGYARVRQELAHTLYIMGDPEGSRHHFEFLARTTDIDSRESLYDRYLVSARKKRPWTFDLSLGLAPSSNINNAARTRIVHVGGVPFLTHEDEKSGVGASYNLAGTYRFDMAERFALTVGGAARGASYKDSDYDRTLFETFSELSVHSGRWRLGAGIAADRMLVGWDGYRWGIGPYVSARRDFGRRGMLAARLSWKHRRYDEATAFDGSESDFSLRYRYAFTPRIAMTAGLKGRIVDTERDHSAYHAVNPSLSLDYAINKHIVAHAYASYERRSYKGEFPLTGERRRDDRFDIVVAATLPSLSFRDFSPRVSYGYHVADSNIELYERRRHSFGLQLTKRY